LADAPASLSDWPPTLAGTARGKGIDVLERAHHSFVAHGSVERPSHAGAP
jgi:hypothetical protein